MTDPAPAQLSKAARGTPMLSAVVVSYQTRDELVRCLDLLAERVGSAHEVIVVDNASCDGSADAARAHVSQPVVVANADNRGFGAAANQGIAAARTAYVLLLNCDVEIQPGAVAALCAVLDRHTDVAVAGPRTRYPDAAIQVSYGPDLTLASEIRQRRRVRGVRRRDPNVLRMLEVETEKDHEPDWLSGHCLLARVEAVRAIGGFDEGFFLYEEDADLCLRLRRAGWRILFTPRAEVTHRLGAAMEKASVRAQLAYRLSHLRYYAKHAPAWQSIVMRLWVALSAGLDWLGSHTRGAAGGERRRAAAVAVRSALVGGARSRVPRAAR